MSNIFKPGSCESYLYKAMQENMAANKSIKKTSIDKVAEAVDLLNRVAELFDDTGLYTESEIITRMLERIASKNIKKEGNFGHLSKDDLKFYEGLAPHHKNELNKFLSQHPLTKEIENTDKFVDALRKMRINHMIGEELSNRRNEQPEVLEFESLISPEKSNPNEDIIEFTSMPLKKKD